MAKKSDRVRRREQKKADKAIKNASRIRPKRATETVQKDALSFPENHLITLDDLTKPKN